MLIFSFLILSVAVIIFLGRGTVCMAYLKIVTRAIPEPFSNVPEVARRKGLKTFWPTLEVKRIQM